MNHTIIEHAIHTGNLFSAGQHTLGATKGGDGWQVSVRFQNYGDAQDFLTELLLFKILATEENRDKGSEASNEHEQK